MARIKQELEFPLRASPAIIYDYLSSTSNLAQWFCDDLKAKDKDNYVFIWDNGNEERKARIEKKVRGKLIKWSWEDAPEGEYLQLEVIKDDMTGDVLVKYTDLCHAQEAKFNPDVWGTVLPHLSLVAGFHKASHPARPFFSFRP